MSDLRTLQLDQAQLLVIDVQQKLLPHIAEHESVVAQCARIIRAVHALGLPVTLTEQYPQGLGRTVEVVRTAADGDPVLEKMTFSVWRDEACQARLRDSDRPQVILAGIEAHVCVAKTATDLQESGLHPVLLADAVGARRAFDRDTAMRRLARRGVTVTTVEAAIFEVLERADSTLFKNILPIVK